MTNQESSNKPNYKQDIKDSSISSSNIQQAQTGEGSTVKQYIIYQFFSGFVNSKLRKLNLIDLFVMIAASVAISSIVMGIRYLGVLQGLELKAFDLLMQLRPAQNIDPRILVVTIDDEDLEYQDQKKMKRTPVSSLSDEALPKLLNELEKLQPDIIGLNIYHQEPFGSALPTQFREDYRFFVTCKIPSPDEGERNGVPPPKDIPQQFHGFTDVLTDPDGIIRRHLLTMSGSQTHPCSTGFSFSFLIALHYLNNVNQIEAKLTPKDEYQFDKLVLAGLTDRSSGYQRLDARGSQILLNYRSYNSPKDIVNSVPLRNILKNGINVNQYKQEKDLIILIGNISESEGFNDYFHTPYGQKIPGVFLQAQMISQIISAVLDDRPLLWWWSGWIEAVWIGGWSVAGGILALCFRQRMYLVLTGGGVLGLAIFCICFFILTKAGWVPLVPPLFSLLGTQVVVIWWAKYSLYFRSSERNNDSES